MTQSRQVLEQLEQAGVFPLRMKSITTRGDMESETPLAEMEGKDFFTKELDRALVAGEVDLVVHSYKDLGSERPEGIELGAITERLYAHDILLCTKSTIATMKKGQMMKFRVGTCSPRRAYNLENFLADFLPYGKNIQVLSSPLRGNVTTRLEQLKKKNFDGIVLALAGLERLAEESEAVSLLDGLDYMVLPKSVFVPAAAQGALAIEIRDDCPNELRRAVEKLNHNITREEVSREKSIFQSYGGGCQLAVGINVQKKRDFFLVAERGFYDGDTISRCRLLGVRPAPKGRGMVVGREHDELVRKIPLEVAAQNVKGDNAALMVTSSHCLDALEQLPAFRQFFSSGVKTHKRMAKRGYWVHLCSDSLGEDEVQRLSKSKVLKRMGNPEQNYVLTGQGSVSQIGTTLACYERVSNGSAKPSLMREIEGVEVFYWMSFPQYQAYREHFPFIVERQHACGLGKTWNAFLDNAIEVIPFAHPEEFENWWREGGK